MAEGKKSFVLYSDLIHTVIKMPIKKRGELFTIILEYVNDLDPSTNDMIVDLVFEPVKRQLKRDLEKWGETQGKRVESGRQGGIKSGETRRRKANEANEASALKSKQIEANEAVNVTDTVIVNVTDNDTIVNEICNFAWSLFPKTVRPKKEEVNIMKSWIDTIDKLIRIDGKDPAEIQQVITWAREDDFWKSNFLTIVKLRNKKDGIKYYDIFNENRKNGKQRTKIDTKTISEFDPKSYDGFRGSDTSDRPSDQGGK